MRGPAAWTSLSLVVSFPVLLACRLGDDGRVDVGEDVVLHVIAVDRRDDGPVADGHHERGAVHEDDRLARALAGGAVHPPLEALERALAELDPAAAHALERVSRELDLSGLLGKHVAERRALEGRRRGGRLLRRRDVERRRRDGARRDQRGVVRRRAHLTWVTEPESMPATPSTVSVAVPSAISTVSTLPVFGAPLESRYVTVWPISDSAPFVLSVSTIFWVDAAMFETCSSCEKAAICPIHCWSSEGASGSWCWSWPTSSLRKSSLPSVGVAVFAGVVLLLLLVFERGLTVDICVSYART